MVNNKSDKNNNTQVVKKSASEFNSTDSAHSPFKPIVPKRGPL